MPTLPILDVPQTGATANRFYADCAIACALSLLLWSDKGDGLTVNSLAAETTLAQADVGLDMIAIVDLLTAHGLGCRVNALTIAVDIRAQIDAGRPVIVALIWQGRRHAVTVRGYDAAGFIINDPASAITRATAGEIERGMAALGWGRQCVFVTDPPPPPLVGPAVATGAVNVRKVPLGKILDTLPAGTVVEVVGSENGWSRIALTGYVATELLRRG